ncbi:hypothetical protein A2963_02370 [Candidatus Roizmanbacteria bacterium RIFCSPLOWO2_01_FULL_40_13]|nr:MAG: hypothetical protein A2963_02370 [Candidatus Roizmanbacteria bacterium RIFCSPLOWO2_01_FULL_40_13]
MYYLYILKSDKYKKIYIGVSQNLSDRLVKHNKGWSKSTKPYIPWKIVYQEKYLDKRKAYKGEYYLKNPKGFLEKKSIISRFI